MRILRITKRQAETIFCQVEVGINVDNQLQRTLEFILDLLWRYKEVAIVQGHFTHPLKTSQGTRFFVAVHHANLSNTDWQFTVRVNVVFVDLDVVRTVHGTKNKLFSITHIHGWEHILLVVLPVARSLIKFHRSQRRSVDVLVAGS